MSLSTPQIQLFVALFRGREDVFARRWERADKSGYAPAYDFDFDDYARHKALGGTLKDFPAKQYSKLTAEVLREHLSGMAIIGVYPLLTDNTSWFLAVDFDEQAWQIEIVQFYNQCRHRNLPVYLERSRSGNGGHVWLFFEAPYPSHKSRIIAKNLLKGAGLLDKTASNSFDRIFPNQDYLSGKGLGNLIALPLQGKALQQGNTAFLHPDSLEAIEDQWSFLEAVRKISTADLDQLWREAGELIKQPGPVQSLEGLKPGVCITLRNQVFVSRTGLLPEAVSFLRDSLKITNPNYFIRRATGQSTFGLHSSQTSLREDAHQLSFPRGFIGSFLRYCRQHKLEYAFDEQRVKPPATIFSPVGELRAYQRPVLEAVARKDFGVIVLPPGAGKTIIGLSIIAEKEQPALIIVHRRQLFDQWIERIQSFLGIPRFKIGRIKSGQITIGEQITVAMIQSLQMPETRTQVEHSFGLILVDECHHVPSQMYRDVLQYLHTWYLYGLTATPIRKNKDEQLIYHQLGELLYEMPAGTGLPGKGIFIHIRDTDLEVPFNAATDDTETISQILIHDTERNSLIADDVRREVDRSRTVLILTERKAHLDILNQYLKQDFETIILSGDDPEAARKAKIRMVEEGRFQVLITTGQFLGEGIDIETLDCLMLVYPCSFEGKLVQYIGRVQRTDFSPVIYDYRDLHIPYLEKMFRQRNSYYSKLSKAGLIRAYDEYLLRFEEDRFYFGNAINALPLSVLDLGVAIEKFGPAVIWKIRMLKYDESTHAAFVEILDYNASQASQESQLDLSLLSIEQIRFRTIDTTGLLSSVVLKKSPLVAAPVSDDDWHLFEKTVKVPFKKVLFDNGCVTLPYYFSALKKEMTLEIRNPVIRPEFRAVSGYFSKVLKLKSISVTVRIKYSKRMWKIISNEATSEEIATIDAGMIESVRFEFVKSRFMKYRQEQAGAAVQTFSQLQESDPGIRDLIPDETALLDQLLKVESARHYMQLRHLATHHEASVLRLRFVLQPFSFLFLLSGEKQYHIIWETLDSEEATYIWHIEKTKPALRAAIIDIEAALTEMKKTGRQEYLKKEASNFSRIVHDYSDAKRGFVIWKGMLEERMV